MILTLVVRPVALCRRCSIRCNRPATADRRAEEGRQHAHHLPVPQYSTASPPKCRLGTLIAGLQKAAWTGSPGQGRHHPEPGADQDRHGALGGDVEADAREPQPGRRRAGRVARRPSVQLPDHGSATLRIAPDRSARRDHRRDRQRLTGRCSSSGAGAHHLAGLQLRARRHRAAGDLDLNFPHGTQVAGMAAANIAFCFSAANASPGGTGPRPLRAGHLPGRNAAHPDDRRRARRADPAAENLPHPRRHRLTHVAHDRRPSRRFLDLRRQFDAGNPAGMNIKS